MKSLRQIIQESIALAENIQQADKIYFNTGKLSPEVRKYILHITGGDAWTKIITDIYYAELQQQHKVGKMALAAISDDSEDEFEDDGGHIESKNDVLNLEYWKKLKSYYLQLKHYNKNVFPIKNINNTNDIWELIRSLYQRGKILEDMKKLPSIAIRNMKEDIRQERDSKELNHYRSRLEYFIGLYSQLSNRSGRVKGVVDKKMFKSNITLDDLIDFAEEKENLIGGKKLNKASIKKIIAEDPYELQIVYERGDFMIVEVTGPKGIKSIGCNSVWCFTYGPGVYRNRGTWEQNSTNNHVYVMIDFSQPSDSPDFMYVLVKPLDFKEVNDGSGNQDNDSKLADMANQYREDPLNLISHFMSLDDAYRIFNFGEYREGPSSKWPYEDPNQLKLDLKEIRLIIREGLLAEAKKSKFQKLEDNKVPLTDEERKKVMDADAVWHHGPNGAPSPAVWKSVDKNGKTTYVTNTHRAYQTRPTLKGAISIYHSFIKGTA